MLGFIYYCLRVSTNLHYNYDYFIESVKREENGLYDTSSKMHHDVYCEVEGRLSELGFGDTEVMINHLSNLQDIYQPANGVRAHAR